MSACWASLTRGGAAQSESDSSQASDEDGSSRTEEDDEFEDDHEEEEGGHSSSHFSNFLARLDTLIHSKVGFHLTQPRDLKVARAGGRPPVVAKALLARNEGKSLDAYFEVDRQRHLGEGGYATVFEGRHKQTGILHAVKCIYKAHVASQERLQREIDIMMALDHPHVIKLFQTFEDARCVYLILELCKGGELFDRIIETGHLSEPDSAIIMQQIFRAMHYMHQNDICHRDLKPENFLFETKAPIASNSLKVIDFGIAAPCPQGTFLSTKSGTPYYVAPEVIRRNAKYGKECDCWSCGVIMYVLLSGRLPFKGLDEGATLAKVMLGRFGWAGFQGVSEDAKNLIRRLLRLKPAERCTMEQALKDVWILDCLSRQGVADGASRANTATAGLQVVKSLRSFRNENRLKKVALHAVARSFDEERIRQLKNTFQELDADGDGQLTFQELSDGLQAAGVSLSKDNLGGGGLREIMQSIDSDGSGKIDYTEFLAATLEHRLYTQESACWAAFRVFDRNDDGRISFEELATVLQSRDVEHVVGKKAIQNLMKEVDLNGDGAIDFDEFMAMMRK